MSLNQLEDDKKRQFCISDEDTEKSSFFLSRMPFISPLSSEIPEDVPSAPYSVDPCAYLQENQNLEGCDGSHYCQPLSSLSVANGPEYSSVIAPRPNHLSELGCMIADSADQSLNFSHENSHNIPMPGKKYDDLFSPRKTSFAFDSAANESLLNSPETQIEPFPHTSVNYFGDSATLFCNGDKNQHIFPHSRPIKRRRRLNADETNYLQEYFEKNPKPNAENRFVIAQRLGMSVRAIQIWFQNRRAKSRKNSSDRAPSLTFSTVEDYDLGANSLLIDSDEVLPSGSTYSRNFENTSGLPDNGRQIASKNLQWNWHLEYSNVENALKTFKPSMLTPDSPIGLTIKEISAGCYCAESPSDNRLKSILKSNFVANQGVFMEGNDPPNVSSNYINGGDSPFFDSETILDLDQYNDYLEIPAFYDKEKEAKSHSVLLLNRPTEVFERRVNDSEGISENIESFYLESVFNMAEFEQNLSNLTGFSNSPDQLGNSPN